MERNINYAFKLYCEDNKSGTKDQFFRTVQLNFNNFSFEGRDEVMDVFTLSNENIALTDKIIIVLIYLPNLYKKMYNKGIENLNEFERFILVMADENIEFS